MRIIGFVAGLLVMLFSASFIGSVPAFFVGAIVGALLNAALSFVWMYGVRHDILC